MTPPSFSMTPPSFSRVSSVAFPRLHVMRDYECSLLPGVNGNKARKLRTLLSDLPAAGIVSHGGAQSNAMLALSRVCHHHNVPFAYHTRALPRWLRDCPVGNLRRALANGMTLREHPSAVAYDEAIQSMSAGGQSGVFVPQGAAWPDAEVGVKGLAHDIQEWWTGPMRSRASSKLSVVVPAGTGTTALYLARHASAEMDVYAVPCVGDEAGLMRQMRSLDRASGAHNIFPRILSPPRALSVPFASPHAAVLESWRVAVGTHGELLDLVYGAIAWGTLASHSWCPPASEPGSTSLYVNFGGHEGLGTSLSRYARAGLLEDRETAAMVLQEALDAVAADGDAQRFDLDEIGL